MTEFKNSVESFSYKVDQTEDTIIELLDRSFEIIWSEVEKKKEWEL